MNKKLIGYLSFALPLGFLVLSSGLTGCKDPEPPKCVITVLDSTGNGVEDATVYIHSDNSRRRSDNTKGQANQYKTTDTRGKASFEWTMEAILEITVYKDLGAGDSLKGKGSVKLENDKVAQETVTVKRYDK